MFKATGAAHESPVIKATSEAGAARSQSLLQRGMYMTRRSSLPSILLAAGLIAGTAVLAFAQEDGPAPPGWTQDGVGRRGERAGRRAGKARQRMARRHRMDLRGLRGQLDLTDAQRRQLRALRQNAHGANKDERAELRRLRRQEDTLTPEQQARAQALHEQLRANGEARRQQFLSVLTPEQRAQLEQQKSEMRERREERRRRREEFRRRGTEQTPQP
jgi:Spy/CpxP family protein refolding chaperone